MLYPSAAENYWCLRGQDLAVRRRIPAAAMMMGGGKQI